MNKMKPSLEMKYRISLWFGIVFSVVSLAINSFSHFAGLASFIMFWLGVISLGVAIAYKAMLLPRNSDKNHFRKYLIIYILFIIAYYVRLSTNNHLTSIPLLPYFKDIITHKISIADIFGFSICLYLLIRIQQNMNRINPSVKQEEDKIVENTGVFSIALNTIMFIMSFVFIQYSISFLFYNPYEAFEYKLSTIFGFITLGVLMSIIYKIFYFSIHCYNIAGLKRIYFFSTLSFLILSIIFPNIVPVYIGVFQIALGVLALSFNDNDNDKLIRRIFVIILSLGITLVILSHRSSLNLLYENHVKENDKFVIYNEESLLFNSTFMVKGDSLVINNKEVRAHSPIKNSYPEYFSRTNLFTIANIFAIVYLIAFLSIFITSKPYSYRTFNRYKLRNSLGLKLGLTFIAIGVVSAIVIVVAIRNHSNRYIESYSKQNVLKMVKLASVNFTNYTRNDSLDSLKKEWIKMLSNQFHITVNLYDDKNNCIYSQWDKGLGLLTEDIVEYINHAQFTSYVQNIQDEGNSQSVFYSALKDDYENKYVIQYKLLNTNQKLQDRQFYSKIVNIIIMMALIASIMSLIMYKTIMKPLRIIEDSMQNISQRKHIKLEKVSNSEVGDLMNQYNNMIDELDATYNMLRESEHMKAWSLIARQIAHEIKNPLTPIKLKAQMIMRMKEEGDERWLSMVDDAFLTIMTQTDILSNIASDFSKFGNTNRLELRRVNITKMLSELEVLYSCYKTPKVRFIDSYEEDLFACINHDEFWRVLTNICTNAIWAVGNKPNGYVYIKVESDGLTIKIAIEDNGIGINKENEPKIFMPNFTTKSEGSGIGLAMSKQLIERINGHLYFKTKEGRGTTFFINILQTI